MNARQGEARRIPAETLPPVELVDRLLALTTGLTDVIRRETELLRNRARAEIAELQPEKIRLANEYAMDVMAVRGHKNLLDRAPSERVSRLKAAMAELDSTQEAAIVAEGQQTLAPLEEVGSSDGFRGLLGDSPHHTSHMEVEG